MESKRASNSSTRASYSQSFGLWLNEPLLQSPERIGGSIRELGDAGYEIVRLFVRNSNYTHRSPEVIAAVRRAAITARERGMRCVLDCEPHNLIAQDMGARFPEAMGIKLVRCIARVVDENWVLKIEPPSASSGVAPTFDGIEASFVEADGTVRPVALDYTVSRGSQWYRNGDTQREVQYREHAANVAFRREFALQGRLRGVTQGSLIVYARFAVRNLVDFWADGFVRYFDDLLDQYRDIPLDGVSWDEPAADCDWGSYRYGRGFAAAFERANGYALRDRLYLLDTPGMSPEAVRTRLDYYRTLNEGLAWAQARVIEKARALFGKDLLLGTHHTWQGEGGSADYRAGAVDYFRLNDNMDAGYTDCSWWDQDAVAYAYALGSSLGRLTPSGQAEVNTWHYAPTVSNVRTNVNRMTLMNITWFNIWFGRDCDCVMQQGHYTWPATVAAAQRHRQYQQRIGKRRPVTDIAIWHGWEGVCAWNQLGLANAHKAFCLNTSRLFMDRSIAFDFIDSRLLVESRIEDGALVNALGRYRTLVIPYGLVMPRKAFEACRSLAQAGGRVIFVGSPVASDDKGVSLQDEFAALTGVPSMSASHYMSGLDAVCTLPAIRPQRLEVCRPLPEGIPGAIISCEGERHGVRSESGTVVFLTDLDPQQRLIEEIDRGRSVDTEVLGENVLWRRYAGEEGELLVVVAKEDRPMRGLVRWKGRQFELTAGSTGLFEWKDGELHSYGDAAWNRC